MQQMRNTLIMLMTAAMLTPAAAKVCVITYANDMGPRVTAEIRAHEIGHCNCPEWTHPPRKGMFAQGSLPPKQCRGAYKGELVELPMSTKAAIKRCDSLGCSQWWN